MTKLQAIRKTQNKSISFWRFYKDDPYTTGISIISCIAAFIIFVETDQMNEALAFTTGYICDSIAKNITDRSTRNLEQ